jgi:chemotaxis protein histidine kinase CheA
MSSETGLEDVSLLELFRSEVETHSDSLSSALLALERSPGDTSRIDEMMRAAHSIKGASRIVGVDQAVSVAHVMEDCFVAAQKGDITFAPADVDVLLRGVDLLGKISEATRDPKVDLSREFGGAVQTLVAELQAVLSGAAKPTEPAAASTSAAAVTIPSAGSPIVQAPPSSDVTIAFPEILDQPAAEVVRVQLLSAVESGCPAIRFDLRTTKDLDVQGLALLAAAPAHLAKHGRSTPALAGLSAEMATVFRVTGLAEPYGVRRELARAPG